MEAPGGPPGEAWFASLLAMADIEPVARGRAFSYAPALPTSFVIEGVSGGLLIGPAKNGGGFPARLVLRHAAELALGLEICPRDAVLAGLLAARSAALFARLECDVEELAELDAWWDALGAEQLPAKSVLQACWSTLAVHQPGAPREVSTPTVARLEAIWPLLGPAEYLMGTGGDVRIKLDPETGLNTYGCSSRPRPWAVTFASSTASSISERGYAGAERARRRLLAHAVEHGVTASTQAAAENVRRALADYYGLPPDARIVLAPSGTDGELCALTVAHLGGGGEALTNLVVAPEETGTGVPLAAAGHHFDRLTARGMTVVSESVIDGFPPDIELQLLRVRDQDGQLRPSEALTAECAAKAASALARGRRVLLHLMDQSKTGLVISETLASVATARCDIDVIVDACQSRLSASSVRDYLRRGFMVLLTGSKFFTGPPFSGALLLPAPLAGRLDGQKKLPRGLAQYFGRFDWPEAAACRELSPDGNVGLVLRWEAALAEMRAFAAVGEARITEILGDFGRRIGTGILANRDLCLHETPPPARTKGRPERWDGLRTIFAFSIWTADVGTGARRLMSLEEARRIYRWLNADVSDLLAECASEAERTLAARQFHLGQPVSIATSQGPAGALRISAGARLVSGEPSQAALETKARVEREIGDALEGLDKISLLVRHLDRLAAVDPKPRYRG